MRLTLTINNHLSDIHASADFRAELARVYTRRALESAVARAKG